MLRSRLRVGALLASALLACCDGDRDGETKDVTKDVTPPSTPASVRARFDGPTTIIVEWDLSTDDVGVTGYRLRRNGADLGSVPRPPFLDIGIGQAGSSCYTVAALDAAGNESPPSAEACARTGPFQVSTIDDTAGAGYACSIAVDVTGTAHVLYEVRRLAAPSLLRYATNASGAWAVEPVAEPRDPPSVSKNRVAVDAHGDVHLAFDDEGSVQYATRRSGAWAIERIASGELGALALDSAGRVHLGFTHVSGLSYAAAVASNETGAWTTTDVTEAGCCGMDLALDPGDHLQVVYSGDVGTIRYGTDASGDFTSSQLDSGLYAAIAPAADGSAHVAYYDYARTEVRCATNRGGSWAAERAYYAGNGGYFVSIALDPDGHVHLAVPTLTSGLFYVTNASGAWVASRLDTGWAHQGAALAVDRGGGVHLCFVGADGLAYATTR